MSQKRTLESTDQILFILSENAGKGKRRELNIATYVTDLYKRKKRDTQLHLLSTRYSGHAAEAADKFMKNYGEHAVIYVCGGDGTSHEVAQVLAHTPAHMGIIPQGTANDFAKTLYGKTHNLPEILDGTLNPSFEHCDLIRINDRYSINVTSTGYDTVVLNKAYEILAKHPRRSQAAYMQAVLGTLGRLGTQRLKISFTDTEGNRTELIEDITLLTICNGGFYGSGFNPAPDADCADGILELLFAEKLNLTQFIPLMLRYKAGTHLSSDKINYRKVLAGTIATVDGSDLLANSDGVIFRSPEIRFEVVPRALNFVRPGKS